MSKKAAEHHKQSQEHHTHAARHHGEEVVDLRFVLEAASVGGLIHFGRPSPAARP